MDANRTDRNTRPKWVRPNDFISGLPIARILSQPRSFVRSISSANDGEVLAVEGLLVHQDLADRNGLQGFWRRLGCGSEEKHDTGEDGAEGCPLHCLYDS